VARNVFKEAVAGIGLAPDLVDDCVLMASELAANTLHARTAAGAGGGGDRLVSVTTDMGGEPKTSAGPAPSAAPLTSAGPAPSAVPVTSGSPAPSAAPVTSGSPAPSAAPVRPELWLYLRGLGTQRELVCKVFDGYRGWLRGMAPIPETPETPETPGNLGCPCNPGVPGDPRRPGNTGDLNGLDGPGDLDDLDELAAQAVTGRGLQIVHELSGGRWGYHPTRARVGGWDVRGKAVWFAIPAPLAHARLVDVTGLTEYTLSADVTATRARGQLGARQSAARLRAMLDERGFGGRLASVDRPGVSVLHICRGLTVWCRSSTVSLTTPDGWVQQWGHTDLVDATEQTVRWYEELDMARQLLSVKAPSSA
jgi:hypothetical protein